MILTQEGWVEVVEETLVAMPSSYVYAALVAIFFCMVHMFMQLVSMSFTSRVWHDVLY